MQIKLFLNSAFELKNVNWRYGNLQPYAIAWIDSSAKCSTKVDVNNGDNPVWNEKFTIQLPPTSHPETAILYIEIVHAKPAADIKALVGSAKLPIIMALNEVRSKGKALFSLVLERPSGRPQGSLEIQIEMKDINIIQNASYGQPAQNMPPQSQPQLQQMTQAQYRPVQVMNQYRNMPVRPGYLANAPLNFRPTLAQQPGNALLMQPGRFQSRPVNPQASSLGLGNALCSLAFGVNPMQIKRMMGSIQQIQAATFHRAQATNGMLNNNGFLGSSGNDPSAAQGFGMDGSGNVGYDNGTGVDGQFGTDGGFGDGGFGTGGLDMGGLGTGGLDMGGLNMGGLDMGGFDLGSGLDLGGLDFSGLSM